VGGLRVHTRVCIHLHTPTDELKQPKRPLPPYIACCSAPAQCLPPHLPACPPTRLPTFPPARLPPSLVCSVTSLTDDPVYSYLSTHLASISRAAAHSHTSATTPASSKGSGLLSSPGASSPLAPEVQQWEVRWEDLHLVRPIGRGSYGRVSNRAGQGK